jgi:molybdate transport system substrate-binding protein
MAGIEYKPRAQRILKVKRRHNLFAVLTLSLLSFTACAGEINVAVASNFTATMNDIAALFEKESGHKLSLSFGSSGKLYAQIKNGAPFQVFLSADQEKPLELEKDGLTIADTRFTYAIGTLALWSAKTGFVDQDAGVLKSGLFNKLAIANPRLAPYGAATMEVLQHFGLAESLVKKLVQGENIAQTYQFVETGNAELGFVALSQIKDKRGMKHGSAWIVPAGLHSPIRQDAVVLKAGADSWAAHELLRFMRSTPAKSIIASYGYRTED